MDKNGQVEKEVYIRFMAQVNPVTTDCLFKIIDQKIQQKYKRIHLLLSSPGGSVFHGVSIYNFLKGAPIETYTYNFGSVDSVGVIIFCAGIKRFSVPHARFLIHGVTYSINANGMVSFDEKQLDEHYKSLVIDQKNIAKVIADNCKKTPSQLEADINGRTTLNPEQAKTYGLVHEIKSSLLPLDAELYTIGEFSTPPPPRIPSIPAPQVQAISNSWDLSVASSTS